MAIARVWLILMVAAWLAGCASTREDEVSTIPWNRPQSWEGSSGFGGLRTPGSPGY